MDKNKRKKRLIFSMIVSCMIICLTALFWYLDHDVRRSREPISSESRQCIAEIASKLNDGDIICRAGTGIWAEAVASCSRQDKRYSHVGILFFQSGEWMVIHSEADGFLGNKKGVFIEQAASFINTCNNFAVYRLKNAKAAAALPGCAEKYLDVPFDFSFDIEDQKSIYCSELIYLAMRDVGEELKTYVHPQLERRIIPIESCQDPEIFDEILAVSKRSGQRNSPSSGLF